jgi:hypothetical protein
MRLKNEDEHPACPDFLDFPAFLRAWANPEIRLW